MTSYRCSFSVWCTTAPGAAKRLSRHSTRRHAEASIATVTSTSTAACAPRPSVCAQRVSPDRPWLPPGMTSELCCSACDVINKPSAHSSQRLQDGPIFGPHSVRSRAYRRLPGVRDPLSRTAN